MISNVSSDGFLFTDSVDPRRLSRPGCIIAAPSDPANAPGVDQDYVFNWTRDAAVTALEIAAAALPVRPGGRVQPLIDYVTFAKTGQDAVLSQNGTPTLAHALQTLAILASWSQLDEAARALATQVIHTNLGFLLDAYTEQTINLWEDRSGYSFFARAVQLTGDRVHRLRPAGHRPGGVLPVHRGPGGGGADPAGAARRLRRDRARREGARREGAHRHLRQ